MSCEKFRKELVLLYLNKVQDIDQLVLIVETREDLAQKAWAFAIAIENNEPTDMDQINDSRWAEFGNNKETDE